MMVACLKDYLFSKQLCVSEQVQTAFPEMTEGFLENLTDQFGKVHIKRKLFPNHSFLMEGKRLRSQSELILCDRDKDQMTSMLDATKPQSLSLSSDVPINKDDSKEEKVEDGGTTNDNQIETTALSEVPIPPEEIPDIVSSKNKGTSNLVPSSPVSPTGSEYELISKDMLKNVSADGISDRECSPSRSSNESENSSISSRSRHLSTSSLVDSKALNDIHHT